MYSRATDSSVCGYVLLEKPIECESSEFRLTEPNRFLRRIGLRHTDVTICYLRDLRLVNLRLIDLPTYALPTYELMTNEITCSCLSDVVSWSKIS